MSGDKQFDPSAITRSASDTFHVNRVFGEPYEHAGRVVIPVARIMGAAGSGGGAGTAGGGGGDDDSDHAKRHDEAGGAGGGQMMRVKPLGVYVMDDSGVHWRPTLDVNRIVLGGQVVGAVAVVVLGSMFGLAATLRRFRRRPHLHPGHHGVHLGMHGHLGTQGQD